MDTARLAEIIGSGGVRVERLGVGEARLQRLGVGESRLTVSGDQANLAGKRNEG